MMNWYRIRDEDEAAFHTFERDMAEMQAERGEAVSQDDLMALLNKLRRAIGEDEFRQFMEGYNAHQVLTGRPESRLVGEACPA